MSWIKRITWLIRDGFIFLLIGLITLEILSFILSYYKLLPINNTPQIYMGQKQLLRPSSWRTERDDWGAWHELNSETRDARGCFDVTYTSNEVGARDASFADLEHKNFRNYILIGDSFAEGWGVNIEQTAQKVIEKKTGVNVLNFGSAGNLGPVQYEIMYRTFAHKYPHQGLIIFFLPDNDFTDNDIEYWRKKDKQLVRWRPYYLKQADGAYASFIPPTAQKTAQNNILATDFLANYFWLSNVYQTYRLAIFREKEPKLYSGYFDASLEQQKAALYFVDKLVNEAAASDIMIVAIPRKQDFMKIAEGEDRREMFWYQRLQETSQRLQKQVTFVDLADYIDPSKVDDLFIACDGHWSAKGNQWAANIIAAKLNSHHPH